MGVNVPPATLADHVPPVAEPPTEPPRPDVVPPLQIADNALPAFTVGAEQPLTLIPVCDGQQFPLEVEVQASEVFDVGMVRLDTTFRTASVFVDVCSSIFVKLVGAVNVLVVVFPERNKLVTSKARSLELTVKFVLKVMDVVFEEELTFLLSVIGVL